MQRPCLWLTGRAAGVSRGRLCQGRLARAGGGRIDSEMPTSRHAIGLDIGALLRRRRATDPHRRGWSAQFVERRSTESETAAMLRIVLEGRLADVVAHGPAPLPAAAAATELRATTAPPNLRDARQRTAAVAPVGAGPTVGRPPAGPGAPAGVSLALQRAPARIVTSSFVEAALTWTPSREDSLPVVPARTGLPRVATAPARVQAPPADVVGRVAPTAQQAPTSGESPQEHRERAARTPLVRLSETTDLARVDPESLHVDVGTPGDLAAPATVAPVTELHSTACGGVFFLLNLGLRLGLYGDFTTPAQPGIGLPIWDFVSIVGRRLAGAGVAADPIWRLLADLSGRRPGDPPGAGFEPPRAWRIPGVWLRPFSRSPDVALVRVVGPPASSHPQGFSSSMCRAPPTNQPRDN